MVKLSQSLNSKIISHIGHAWKGVVHAGKKHVSCCALYDSVSSCVCGHHSIISMSFICALQLKVDRRLRCQLDDAAAPFGRRITANCTFDLSMVDWTYNISSCLPEQGSRKLIEYIYSTNWKMTTADSRHSFDGQKVILLKFSSTSVSTPRHSRLAVCCEENCFMGIF